MSDKSDIEWTDATWNAVRGCTKISPGCQKCYAATFAERFRGVPGHPYEQGFDLRIVPEKLNEPLKWKKPRRIFVNSMSDLFQDGVTDGYITEVCLVMEAAHWHTFQVLTKRHQRLFDFLSAHPRFANLENVWWGVSAEDRKYGLPRVELLRRTPCLNRFVSFEPLLEDLGVFDLSGIRWGIIGAESGHGARPMALEWARNLLVLFGKYDVSPFVKQLGRYPTPQKRSYYTGEFLPAGSQIFPQENEPISMLKDPKGGDMAEWPDDLKIREFPQ